MRNLNSRIKKVANTIYPPVDVRTLSDEALEAIVGERSARAPQQSAAVDNVIKSLTDEELIALRDGKKHLLSTETRRRLNHAAQTKN